MATADVDLDDLDLDGIDLTEGTPVMVAPVQQQQPQRAQPRRKFDESIVYFDIETVPDFSRIEQFGLPPLPQPRAAKPALECPPLADMLGGTLDAVGKALTEHWPDDEYLDALLSAELLAAKPRKGVMDAVAGIRAERERLATAEADRNKLLATTPEFCRIVALGFARDDDDPEALLAERKGDGATAEANAELDDEAERKLLCTFWAECSRTYCRSVCGYNVAGFDLPVILTRSALLDVEPTRMFDLRPFGSRDVLDLMKLRFGTGRAAKLKDLARWLGIDIPAGDCEGSQVLGLWQSDPAKLRQYVASDVVIVRRLHERLAGYFWA